jgi:hypothetical protein
MAVVALVSVAAIAAGALLGQDWLAALGGFLLPWAPAGLLVPVIQRQHRRSPEGGYHDMHYLGGLLTIMGFDAAERDSAFTRRRRQPGERL